MDKTQEFQPGQIVYLEEGDTRLYAEVIQVVISRQRCWTRPLILEIKSGNEFQIADLRESFDLLWPVNLFYPALDVEVVTLMSKIMREETKTETTFNFCQQKFHQFLNRVCQTQKNLILDDR